MIISWRAYINNHRMHQMHQARIQTERHDDDTARLVAFAEDLIEQDFECPKFTSTRAGHPYIAGVIRNKRRAGHQLLYVRHAGQSYVFKVFADCGGHRLGRRLEFFLRNLLRDPALRSYNGARKLQQAGIPTLDPVACVSAGPRWHRRGIFIYRKVPAVANLHQWLGNGADYRTAVASMRQLGRQVRRMHQANLHSRDLTLGNVLINFSRDGHNTTPDLHLIDTDDIQHLRIGWLPFPLRMLTNIWFMRRMKPSLRLSYAFMSEYLKDHYRAAWLRLWLFYRNGGLNFWKRSKHYLREKFEGFVVFLHVLDDVLIHALDDIVWQLRFFITP